MQNPPRSSDYPDYPSSPSPRRRILFGILGSVLVLAAIVGTFMLLGRGRGSRLGAPTPMGAPVLVRTPTGDALFLVTGQWETQLVNMELSGTGLGRTDLHVDVWRFDPATMRPVWRRRVLTERDGAMQGIAPLGAHGDVLWLFARQLLGVRLDDGRLVADAASLERGNGDLRGLLPKESRWYAFDTAGVRMTLTDARVVHVHPEGLRAWEARAGAPAPLPPVAWPASLVPAGTNSFRERGMSWPGRWLGVMTDAEGAAFARGSLDSTGGPPRTDREYHERTRFGPPSLDGYAPSRYRVWSARVTKVSAAPPNWPANFPNNWGTRDEYSEVRPLPESAEFLQAGLLTANLARTGPDQPIFVRNPDGVLVLHRDRLGDEGRLRLARVNGPAGRTGWDAALPMSALESVAPGEGTLVLLGTEKVQVKVRGSRERTEVADLLRLVSVDLATGAVRAYDMATESLQQKAEPARPE